MESDEKRRLSHLIRLLGRAGLNKQKRKPTFMEVAGIERREVSVSKILAFLLDDTAEHGMGDLWVRSLMLAASESDATFDPISLQTAPSTTHTEVVTRNVDANLRIDVVVETPDFVLGVENKIGASLYNDLVAYAGQIHDMAGERTPFLLTLTLHDEADATARQEASCSKLGVALCNVTYPALFARVKEGIGQAMLTADQEWVGYVRDFMRTIENLGDPEMQFDKELFTFMSENGPEIALLKRKMEEVASSTKAQGQRLQSQLEDDEEIAAMHLGRAKVWSPDKYYLWCSTFFDLPLQGRGQRIHPEISNEISKMQVRCWVSSPSARAAVRKAFEEANLPIAEERESFIVYLNLPLETADEELINELKVMLRAILPIVGR